jgi:hypothetical protein
MLYEQQVRQFVQAAVLGPSGQWQHLQLSNSLHLGSVSAK